MREGSPLRTKKILHVVVFRNNPRSPVKRYDTLTAHTSPSAPFWPLRDHPGGSAPDRTHHTHRTPKGAAPTDPSPSKMSLSARYDPTGDASRASRAPLPYSESERATRVKRNRRLFTLGIFCLAEILACNYCVSVEYDLTYSNTSSRSSHRTHPGAHRACRTW